MVNFDFLCLDVAIGIVWMEYWQTSKLKCLNVYNYK